jgi:hypothetical protein
MRPSVAASCRSLAQRCTKEAPCCPTGHGYELCQADRKPIAPIQWMVIFLLDVLILLTIAFVHLIGVQLLSPT